MNVFHVVIFLFLLYLSGIVILAFLANISWGILLFHGIIFMASLWYVRKNSRGRIGLILLFAVTTIAICTVPDVLKMQMVIQEFLFMGILFYMTWQEEKENAVLSYCHISRLSFFQIPVIILETFLLIVVAGYINACSMLFFRNTVTDTLITAAGFFPAAILIFGLAPSVTEELIFRGCILRSFRNRKAGIVLSAVLFALWHQNPNQMSYAFAAGLMLAFMAVWMDNLTCTMLTHFLFNIYNIIVTYITTDSFLGRVLFSWKIGSYCLLAPNITTMSGGIIWKNLCWGFAVMVMAAAIYLGILYMIQRVCR